MTLKFRNRLSALSALGVLAITSLVVSACSGTSANAGGDGGDGGELVHAVTALDGGWQQQASNDWYKSQVWTQLVETLVYVDDAGKCTRGWPTNGKKAQTGSPTRSACTTE